jgi:hypothetical protein
MNLQGKHQDDATTVASVTTTVGAKNAVTTTAVKLPGMVHGIVFVLDVTAAATAAGDTLDVAVQTLIDGTNYVDVVAFTQCVGNGGAKRHIAKINADVAQAMFEVGSALAAGNVRNILGDAWRVKYTQVDDGDQNAIFTFKVTALPM